MKNDSGIRYWIDTWYYQPSPVEMQSGPIHEWRSRCGEAQWSKVSIP